MSANICHECGMVCTATEYHPYAACLMFKGCHDGDMVRANLAAIHTKEAAPSEEQWQPIETAPVDVLLLLSDVEFPSSDGKPPVKVGGYWDWKWHIFGASWKPTHWMPLPAPPLAATQEKP